MPEPTVLADRMAPELRAAFLTMVATLRDSPARDQLQDLIDTNDIAGIVRLFELTYRDLSPIATEVLVPPYQSLIERVGTSTLRSVAPSVAFDTATRTAEAWINQRSGSMVVGITEDALESLRRTLGSGYQTALGSRWTGRQIRSLVGLLPQHSAAVARYGAGLRSIGTPSPQVEHFSTTYATRLLNYRSESIARTETMTAAHFGQYEAWRQAFAKGYLNLHTTWVEWVLTEDDRLCPLCAVMEDKRVRFGEFFSTSVKGFPNGKPKVSTPGSRRKRKGPIKPDPLSQPRDRYGRFTRISKRDVNDHLDGVLVDLKDPISVLHPPLHPQCRCSMRLVFEDG